MDSGTENNLHGVWGRSATDIFAVGGWCDEFTSQCGGTTILHYDGSDWSSMNTSATIALNDIWSSSGNEVFAVGHDCDIREPELVEECWSDILSHDGNEWVQMESGLPGVISGIWGSSSTDVFAVGGRYDFLTDTKSSIIMHFDGNMWSANNSGIDKILVDVWGSSSTDVLAVGFAGVTAHYNGNSWQELEDPCENISCDVLSGIWGSSATDVFLVGSEGTILHYDGIDWTVMSRDLLQWFKGVWGTSAEDVFAVGQNGNIVHYDGIEWSDVGTDEIVTYNDVWGSSSTDVFVVGDDGKILKLFCNSE